MCHNCKKILSKNTLHVGYSSRIFLIKLTEFSGTKFMGSISGSGSSLLATANTTFKLKNQLLSLS